MKTNTISFDDFKFDYCSVDRSIQFSGKITTNPKLDCEIDWFMDNESQNFYNNNYEEINKAIVMEFTEQFNNKANDMLRPSISKLFDR